MPSSKYFDDVVKAAFKAGAEYALEAEGGRPALSTETAYSLWRRSWAGVPHEPSGEATEDAGEWVPAAGCTLPHQYGEEGWRPANLGHEHLVVDHRFDPGYTGMSAQCNQLMIRDGDTAECDLPRWRHPEHPHYTPGDPPGHYTITAEEAQDMGAAMGHPGGHYG